jgi:tetratricopeptide (TPR) repeat protein
MQRVPNISPQLETNVMRWLRGEITWAQVEGFTSTQAREFAKAACDLAKRGQFKKAAAILEGLVAMNPYDHGSRSALGTVYRKMGRNEEALDAYDHALAVNGRDVVALANRGELRLQASDARGLADLRKAVEVDPRLKTASAKRAAAITDTLIKRQRH